MPSCLLLKAVFWDDGHPAHCPLHCTSNILHDLLKAFGGYHAFDAALQAAFCPLQLICLLKAHCILCYLI